jgi:3'-phosphoadenosine 5'-phosphosulfate sulfotransferase (PAPS reductase)/FAD synthetase
MSRVVAWFSCGVTSAIAAELALEAYPDAVVAYCDTGSEHPDNARFIRDCELWLGARITVLRSKKFKDIWSVFETRKYLAGVKGAPCTTELKKLVRREFERPDDLQIFGFDNSERERADRFRGNNPECDVDFPLIRAGLSKDDCLKRLTRAGIALPVMYQLGYRNNNCIGCVKGQAGYWNKIRVDFPDTFKRMARMERQIGAALNKSYAGDGKRKRIFLDELDPKAGRYQDLEITCGLFCGEQ